MRWLLLAACDLPQKTKTLSQVSIKGRVIQNALHQISISSWSANCPSRVCRNKLRYLYTAGNLSGRLIHTALFQPSTNRGCSCSCTDYWMHTTFLKHNSFVFLQGMGCRQQQLVEQVSKGNVEWEVSFSISWLCFFAHRRRARRSSSAELVSAATCECPRRGINKVSLILTIAAGQHKCLLQLCLGKDGVGSWLYSSQGQITELSQCVLLHLRSRDI